MLLKPLLGLSELATEMRARRLEISNLALLVSCAPLKLDLHLLSRDQICPGEDLRFLSRGGTPLVVWC